MHGHNLLWVNFLPQSFITVTGNHINVESAVLLSSMEMPHNLNSSKLKCYQNR